MRCNHTQKIEKRCFNHERRNHMTQEEKSARELQAEEHLRLAKARLIKVRREEKQRLRKEQDHHKYIMGGIVVKYFPEAYSFTELEMNRIIACAFSLEDVQNMITKVVNERTENAAEKENEGYETN